jgi:hypothetical protein
MILLLCANSFDSFNNKLTELGKKKQKKIGKTQVLFSKTALFQVFFLKKKKLVVVLVTMPKTTGFLLVQEEENSKPQAPLTILNYKTNSAFFLRLL